MKNMESKKKFILYFSFGLSILAFLIFLITNFLSFDKSDKGTERLENLIYISLKGIDREAVISVRETVVEGIIENKAGYEILIKNISSNFMIRNFSCDKKIILPNEKTKCSLTITPEPSLAFYIQIDYEYSKLGERVSEKAIKWIIDKLFLKPYEVKQIYRGYTNREDKNEFFYSSDVNDNKFYVGYECSSINGENVKKEKRANLKFDVSRLPDKAEILGAGLYLDVSKISAPIDIGLRYEYDKQKQLGIQKISNSGLHMFDVAEIIKKEKRLHDGVFQILSKEVYCGDIKENYVEFSLEEKQGSFLEIVYINP